ncbi:MAG: HAMP domain-containing histidine kinase [Bacteroidales bacterium]|jgi:signal transduction histidine kinase|nr:HAMP domain-containing histidine kinase [Bacteroidales bacterium]
MRLIHKLGKNNVFLYLILSFFFYGLTYVVQQYTNGEPNPNSSAKIIQEKIIDAENSSKKVLDHFCTNFDTITGYTTNHPDNWIKSNIDPGDFLIFVYKHNSLIFWNDNKIPINENLIQSSRGPFFVTKLKNGWYAFQFKKHGSFLCYCGFLIRSEFPIQNDYIKNQFSPRFNVPEYINITQVRNDHPVFSAEGNYLFSIVIGKNHKHSNAISAMLLFLFLCGSWYLFFFLYRAFLNLTWLKNRKGLLVLFLSFDIVLLRIVQFYFRFPQELYQSDIFGPSWYASSAIMNSLGDFVVNAFLLLLLALVFFHNRQSFHETYVKKFGKTIYPVIICILLLAFAFQALTHFIEDAVVNSSLALNLQNIAALNFNSCYGLFIICCLFFAFWCLSTGVSHIIFSLQVGLGKIFVAGGIALVLYGIICLWTKWPWQMLTVLFFTGYLLFLLYISKKRRPLFTFQYLLFFFCFFSAYGTCILNQANREKEKEKRKVFAVKMATRRNPVTETLYEQLERKMVADSIIQEALHSSSGVQEIDQEKISQYIISNFFTDYWTKFNVQVTFCYANKNLQIQPQGYLIKCNDYFQEIIRNYGESTTFRNLFFLDYGYGDERYLIALPEYEFNSRDNAGPCLYLELSIKTAYKDLGYPELLLDKTRFARTDFSEYAYGLYQYDRLVHGVGAYNYRIDLKQYLKSANSWPFFSKDDMEHYYYRVNNSTTLLVSKSKTTLFLWITPFSYLFILFSFIAFLVFSIVNIRKIGKFSPKSLRDRLQVSITGILILTSIIIGVVLILNIIKINQKKNDDNLQEKAFSVLTEIQHKYAGTHEWQTNSKEELNDFLVKLSNVFFTDINFYNNYGDLIATSRPQIFAEGLLSTKMNAYAFWKLIKEKGSFLIHKEEIGSLQYSSAYIPFFNTQNQLLGFVNLPYFSRQDELTKEISIVLVTFTNIYILLILFGVFVTLLISNYITAPLTLLANTMSRLRLDRVNEKINWKQSDEIGQLVGEYNRMVDDLKQSAEMLARSERESAWREMAKQVAHEIKNPLTPMKLNIQYLQKAWDEKAPDWDQRLERFSKTLIEQIDTLSAIASGFSDFAQMPPENRERLNLETLIPFVISLYKDSSPIQFGFASNATNPFVFGDKKQLIRVFTNLINNAIQSIDDPVKGWIQIQMENKTERLILQFSDNGSGIPVKKKDYIFQPNFTTKSSGMGLGLAIVKGIVENMNGEIFFTTEENKGTTFTIKFPGDVDEV